MANRKEKDVIMTSLSAFVMPITLVFGIYIILHGHLSPGGGFQGGVLIAGAIVIFYLAYGRKKTLKTFHLSILSKSESLGGLFFVLFATLGIIYGSSFFANVIYKGSIGKLYSSGTIFLMNFAVGYKVLAGIGILILSLIGILNKDEGGKENDN